MTGIGPLSSMGASVNDAIRHTTYGVGGLGGRYLFSNVTDDKLFVHYLEPEQLIKSFPSSLFMGYTFLVPPERRRVTPSPEARQFKGRCLAFAGVWS